MMCLLPLIYFRPLKVAVGLGTGSYEIRFESCVSIFHHQSFQSFMNINTLKDFDCILFIQLQICQLEQILTNKLLLLYAKVWRLVKSLLF